MGTTKEFNNRRAFFDYHILEKVEAGIELRGTEVKSIREGNINLSESYARAQNDEVFLVNLHIPEYKAGSWMNHDPRRPRKLLLRRREIGKIIQRLELKGLTIVPLRLYFNARGYAKVELGVAKGKQLHDRRNEMKKRDAEREIRRQIAGS